VWNIVCLHEKYRTFHRIKLSNVYSISFTAKIELHIIFKDCIQYISEKKTAEILNEQYRFQQE